jgi:hypothetical protein
LSVGKCADVHDPFDDTTGPTTDNGPLTTD